MSIIASFFFGLMSDVVLQPLHSQEVVGNLVSKIGEVIPDFTLKDTRTGKLVSRDAYSGGILVLDFFAYWCGPCQSSTPGLLKHIEEYYRDQNGNPFGLPVFVVSVNLDSEPSSRAQTLDYISQFQLDSVLDDLESDHVQLFDFMPDTGGIPYFAIINTVEDSADFLQWELLHFQRGYGGDSVFIDSFRPVIDSVSSIKGGIRPLSFAVRLRISMSIQRIHLPYVPLSQVKSL